MRHANREEEERESERAVPGVGVEDPVRRTGLLTGVEGGNQW